jgi:hypothetical protein
MYLEILNNVVADYLAPKEKAVAAIVIHLTPFIYKTLQDELNSVIKFNTEVPIQYIKADSIIIHERTVKIDSNEKLDEKFERRMVEALAIKGTNT